MINAALGNQKLHTFKTNNFASETSNSSSNPATFHPARKQESHYRTISESYDMSNCTYQSALNACMIPDENRRAQNELK